MTSAKVLSSKRESMASDNSGELPESMDTSLPTSFEPGMFKKEKDRDRDVSRDSKDRDKEKDLVREKDKDEDTSDQPPHKKHHHHHHNKVCYYIFGYACRHGFVASIAHCPGSGYYPCHMFKY